MDFEIVRVEPIWVAVVHRHATWPTLMNAIGSALEVDLGSLRSRRTGHQVLAYLAGPGDTVRLSCGFEVEAPFDSVRVGDEEVVCEALPGGEVGHTVHQGAYDGIAAATRALYDWLRAHDRVPGPLSWERYGDWNEDPQFLRTDIQVTLS